ncbi:MAG TPA: YbdD/YjiX family protein [Microlunatus sp.]|nr:YbdD/YjiX family protein [Microlunatus sp.]
MTTPQPTTPGSRATTTARGVWAGLRWYARGVLGGSKYEGYLAWHGRHGEGEPMSEKEYWRHRTQHEEEHPEGRCC